MNKRLSYQCGKCRRTFVVQPDDPELHILDDALKCPYHESCKGKVKKVEPTKLLPEHILISARGLFQAAWGAGLPFERHCSPAEVRKTLLGKKVTEVLLKKAADKNRSLILNLTLEDGKRLHFDTSMHGATIYKVTEHGR